MNMQCQAQDQLQDAFLQGYQAPLDLTESVAQIGDASSTLSPTE